MKLLQCVLIMLVLALACAGCSGFNNDVAEPPDLILTIPASSSARFAAEETILELPGVRNVTSVYHQPGGVLDLWVHYEAVPDRWPFVEKIQLSVESAVRDYNAVRETTVRVWVVDYEPGQAAAVT